MEFSTDRQNKYLYNKKLFKMVWNMKKSIQFFPYYDNPLPPDLQTVLLPSKWEKMNYFPWKVYGGGGTPPWKFHENN